MAMHPAQVEVQTQALADLRTALLAFRGRASEQLRTIGQLLQQFVAALQRQEQISQAQVRQAQAMLQQYKASIAQRGDGDVEVLRRFAHQLRQAEERLRLVRHYQREVAEALQAYLKQAQRLHQQLEQEVPKATALLDRKLASLEQYQGAASPGAGTDRLEPAPASAEPMRQDFARFMTQMSWLRSPVWYDALEAIMVVMTGLNWLAQLNTAPELPEPYQLVETSLQCEHSPVVIISQEAFVEAVEQLVDSQQMDEQKRPEDNRRRRRALEDELSPEHEYPLDPPLDPPPDPPPAGAEPTTSNQFRDGKGRPITIENSEFNNTMYAEARATSNGLNPRVGTITASFEGHTADRRVRIHNVEVIPGYRNAGIGRELLRRVENYAQRNGAREIYGLVADNEARSFWEAQSKNGWELVDNGTKVCKRL